MNPAVGTRPLLVLRRNGCEVGRLTANGGKLLVGRAPASDVVLGHPSVSRLHARISWPQGRSRPIIEDLDSVNGVALDGRRIAQRAELRAGMRLSIGQFELGLELVEDSPPALIEDSDTVQVRLFSEAGPRLEGKLRDAAALRDLLLDLEERRRTGTLHLAEHAQVTFARGRVVDARTRTRRGLPALRELVERQGEASYRFDLDVSPRECPMQVSIRALLESRLADTERVQAGKVAS